MRTTYDVVSPTTRLERLRDYNAAVAQARQLARRGPEGVIVEVLEVAGVGVEPRPVRRCVLVAGVVETRNVGTRVGC